MAKDFQFPFPPYDIQREFMSSVYNTLDSGKIGIFESPTGTGKSLSLICSSLKWLQDQASVRQEKVDRLKAEVDADHGLDWLESHAVIQDKRKKMALLLDEFRDFEIVEEKIKKARDCPDIGLNQNAKKRKIDKLLNDDCDYDGLPDLVDKTIYPKNDLLEKNLLKIIYCSRTHSQLTQVRDIEDVVKSSRAVDCCPYYASRAAVPVAELVVVPYQTVLHDSTRLSSRLSLEGNVVIVDEAHNLLDTLSSIYSATITYSDLETSLGQLNRYLEKLGSRLTPVNLRHVKQLLFVITALMNYLVKLQDSPPPALCLVSNFLFKLNIDNINIFRLVNFCHEARLAQKLRGFLDKTRETSASAAPMTTLNQIISFLKCVTSDDVDGRVMATMKEKSLQQFCIKYIELNPGKHLKPILQSARSVVFAGGTMNPADELRHVLKDCCIPDSRIVELSCDHVIPKDNLLTVGLVAAPSGKLLDFTYANRLSAIGELERVLVNLINVIPGGIVVFLPSFDFLDALRHELDESRISERIACKKRIFFEPRERKHLESVFGEYRTAVQRGKPPVPPGGILFSVVGGKMSEGINFNDELCRCVVMVGLPYPNHTNPEIREKIDYLNRHVSLGRKTPRQLQDSAFGSPGTGQAIQQSLPDATTPGGRYYHGLCMRALNQSIGRSIRHRRDYAVILLLDQRFSRLQVQEGLPNWIRKSFVLRNKFGGAFSDIKEFFSRVY